MRRGLLTIRTLVAKLTGIVFAIGAGVIAGKEGPFVHGGGIVGGGIGGMGSMCGAVGLHLGQALFAPLGQTFLQGLHCSRDRFRERVHAAPQTPSSCTVHQLLDSRLGSMDAHRMGIFQMTMGGSDVITILQDGFRVPSVLCMSAGR